MKTEKSPGKKVESGHLWKILLENMNSYGKYKQIMCIQMGDVRHHLAILLYISFPCFPLIFSPAIFRFRRGWKNFHVKVSKSRQILLFKQKEGAKKNGNFGVFFGSDNGIKGEETTKFNQLLSVWRNLELLFSTNFCGNLSHSEVRWLFLRREFHSI